MAMRPNCHQSLAHCRINIGADVSVRRQYTLLPKGFAFLQSRCGRVSVVLNWQEDLPRSVVGVVVDGVISEDYSIIPNGNKKRQRFALT